MKQTIGILLFLFIAGQAFAASQVPDICIIKKDSTQDTLVVFVYPLEEYFDLQGSHEIPGFKNCNSPSCARGYQAVWKIQNDSLFLINLQGCNEQMSWCDESAMPNLKAMFGDECQNNKVFAKWVTGKYRFMHGDEVPLINKQIFDTEKQITFLAGKVKRNRKVVNVKSRRNGFEVIQSTPDFILYLIHTNLNWKALPKLDKDKWYAEIDVTILKNGKTAIKLITDTKEDFRAVAEQEYLKCLKKVRWYHYRQLGKNVEVKFVVRATFERTEQLITIIK